MSERVPGELLMIKITPIAEGIDYRKSKMHNHIKNHVRSGTATTLFFNMIVIEGFNPGGGGKGGGKEGEGNNAERTPKQSQPSNCLFSKGEYDIWALEDRNTIWPIQTSQLGGYPKWNGPGSVTLEDHRAFLQESENKGKEEKKMDE
ncbi:hypothetical protein Tco_0688928 [Tanacetum coccineum]